MGCGGSKLKAAVEKAGEDMAVAAVQAGAEVAKEAIKAGAEVAKEVVEEVKDEVKEIIEDAVDDIKEKAAAEFRPSVELSTTGPKRSSRQLIVAADEPPALVAEKL